MIRMVKIATKNEKKAKNADDKGPTGRKRKLIILTNHKNFGYYSLLIF